MIRVLIAATSAVVRAGLETLLSRSSSIFVVGSVSQASALDGQHYALADEIESVEPDVVLVDVDGKLDARRAIKLGGLSPDAVGRAPALVLLSDSREPAWLADALSGGVRAVLPRDAPPEEIVGAVESVAVGLIAFSRDLVHALLMAAPRAESAESESSLSTPLTPRESEVLRLLAEGLGNKMVAARLGISEHTVKTHIASVFAKLDVDTRAEAVARGIRLGAILL